MTLRSFTLAIACAGALLSCSSEEQAEQQVTTLTFWHFWSEPHQQAVLDSLLRVYEASHPLVQIESTPLSWSDGKAKLQLAFNSQNAPDVVHLGLDWFAAFNADGVFFPLETNNGLLGNPSGQLWTINARAMVMSASDNTRYYWGLCGSDSHNVLKRVLPIVWQQGAPLFCTSLPISATMDSSLTDALWSLSKLSRPSLVARSRDLDQSFLSNEVRVLYTGTWIKEMARNVGIDSLVVVPTPSILNGDVLSIPQQSTVKPLAEELIGWLTSKRVSSRFCSEIPDAGFPAHYSDADEVDLQPDAVTAGFLKTVQLSSPLPMSSTFLELEPVLEELIERSYSVRSYEEVQRMVEASKQEVLLIESR